MNDIDVNELKEKCKGCTGCLDWLHICHSECCKQLVLRKDMFSDNKLVIGKRYRLNNYVPGVDMRKYLLLHEGFSMIHGQVYFVLGQHVVQGNDVLIFSNCKNLKSDGTCREYHGNRPEICKRLDNDDLQPGGVMTTPRCLYRFKREVKEENERTKTNG